MRGSINPVCGRKDGMPSESQRDPLSPHPARLDGAKDGELNQPHLELLSDPIRLVRMVNQILRRSAPIDLIHHPHEADGVSIK